MILKLIVELILLWLTHHSRLTWLHGRLSVLQRRLTRLHWRLTVALHLRWWHTRLSVLGLTVTWLLRRHHWILSWISRLLLRHHRTLPGINRLLSLHHRILSWITLWLTSILLISILLSISSVLSCIDLWSHLWLTHLHLGGLLSYITPHSVSCRSILLVSIHSSIFVIFLCALSSSLNLCGFSSFFSRIDISLWNDWVLDHIGSSLHRHSLRLLLLNINI